jgi:hypothetical protein
MYIRNELGSSGLDVTSCCRSGSIALGAEMFVGARRPSLWDTGPASDGANGPPAQGFSVRLLTLPGKRPGLRRKSQTPPLGTTPTTQDRTHADVFSNGAQPAALRSWRSHPWGETGRLGLRGSPDASSFSADQQNDRHGHEGCETALSLGWSSRQARSARRSLVGRLFRRLLRADISVVTQRRARKINFSLCPIAAAAGLSASKSGGAVRIARA